MSPTMTIVPCAIAYFFLSVWAALIVGRALRAMNPDDELSDMMPCTAAVGETRAKDMRALTGALLH